MIKGWRNDPAWVAHYKKVESERTAMRKARVDLEMLRLKQDKERSLAAARYACSIGEGARMMGEYDPYSGSFFK